MTGLPCRPPSVDIPLPQNLSYEKVEFDQIYVPANALIIAENEQIFLAMANVLKELKAVLIGDAGYVYTGKIGSRQVFLLKCRGPGAVVQTIKKLKPRAGIFLGFAKSLVNRPHEIGDIIVAEAVLRRDTKQEKLESYGCSECLISVFENGKYGWTPPKYRKQAVHVGKILQMGDFAKNEKASAVAVKTSSLDVSECIKGLRKEWISIVSVTGTPRCHGDRSWEPYVAAVISSFVNRVLEDDQVFAVLGRECRGPRRHSPLLSDPWQETIDTSRKINFYDDRDLSQEEIKRTAEMYWERLQYAIQNGVFHPPPRPDSQSIIHPSPDRFRILPSWKYPVENGDRREVTPPASKHLPISAENLGTHLSLKSSHSLSLPLLPSGKYERAGKPNRKISSPSVKSKILQSSSQSLCPTLSSTMALTTGAALLPLGATLQSQGSLDLSENFLLKLGEDLDDLELRSLSLAQNKLSSLEGIQKLAKLHCLDVRHNQITTITALRAEDIPRLRKLRLAENRISQMREVDQLASFVFLSELYMQPNPVSQLPQYRAQVLHRLPRLRQLDSQQVTPEERVKTEVIFGADVETRQEIFEQLLPEETFVDRRLMTEELIAQLEMEQFGCHGDAGPFGCEATSDPTFGDPPRTKLQVAKFRQRVEQTRRGGSPEGVANFSTYPAPYHSSFAYDEDLPEILEAVAEGGCQELWLGAAEISPQGIREIVASMQDTTSSLRHIDLAGCSSAALLGAELLKSFPLDRGCSIELENCGLADSTVERLRRAR